MTKKPDPIKELVKRIFADRRDRRVNPEGTFDRGQRWFPSDREDCGGSGTSVRTPSRAWPYSYMVRCRTRAHVTNLVAAALRGEDVPADVTEAIIRMSPPLDATIRLGGRPSPGEVASAIEDLR